MPPHIYGTDDEGYPKPFQYLHPGIRKNAFAEQLQQPHVFQQSVTLTASIWNEDESKGSMDWGWDNWRVLAKYSPLFIGLICGFGIVLLIMSTVMLWRYCLVSATKKVCCKGNYGEINEHQKSLPLRRERIQFKNEPENCQNKFAPAERPRCQSALHRSATLGSMAWYNEVENKPLRQGVSTNNIISHFHHHQPSHLQPLMSADLYTSHLYLQKLATTSEEPAKYLSKSTPALEELYAKVNFSKKRKNRMRKNEAAIIAMSKSHSGQNNNSLELFGSAVVVYNERTAL